MRARALLVILTSLMLCVSYSFAGETGQGKTSKTEKDSKGSKGDDSTAGDSYSVVQVGNEVKVVKNSEVNALREKVNEDYKKALQSFEDAKKAATKAKKKFSDAKPVKPVFKTLFTALKSQADANAQRDKAAQKLDAQKKKAREEPSGK